MAREWHTEMKNALTVFVALAAVLVSGCGTIVNLCSGDPQVPLGGVQKDLEAFNTPSSTNLGTGKGAALIVLLLPTELCLSLVGDTLTLPLAIFIKRLGYPRDDGAAPASPGDDQPDRAPRVDAPGELPMREILNRIKNLSDDDRLLLESLAEPVATAPVQK
jgi:uncharacterized protein YceK